MRRAFFFSLVAACASDGGAVSTPTPTSTPSSSSSPARTTIAMGETEPHLVATDGAFVYWTTPSAIRRASADGNGSAVTVANVTNSSAFAIHGDFVLYLAPLDGAVRKVPAAGGSPTDLATHIGFGQGLYVHAGQVYFSSDSKVRRVSVNGGSIDLVADNAIGASGLAVDDTNIHWSSTAMGGSVSSDGPPVSFGGKLVRKPLAGGNGVEVDDAFTAFLAFNGQRLAWQSNSTLKTATTNGPAANVAPIFGLRGPIGLDDQFIYYATSTRVQRVPFAGGEGTDVARGFSAGGMAVDAQAIYLTDPAAGTILRLAKDGSSIEPPQEISGCPTPVGDALEIAKSPRGDVDAEILALSLHPRDIAAHTPDYERVARDLAAIRANEPSVATIQFDESDRTRRSRLEIAFTDRGGRAVLAQSYSAWNCLNTFYGGTVTESTETIDYVYSHVIFRGFFNLQPVQNTYAKLPEVTRAQPSGSGVNADYRAPKLCVKDAGSTWDYYLASGGDLSRGCASPNLTTAAFRVATDGSIVDRYRHEEPPPPWCSDGGVAAPATPPAWTTAICP